MASHLALFALPDKGEAKGAGVPTLYRWVPASSHA
jgi:hypothetical protein